MNNIEIIQVDSQAFKQELFNGVKELINNLKANFQPKEPTEYLTRKEVAELLKCDISTVHNLTKREVLVKHGIGGRVYYKRKEVEQAIIKLN